MQEHFDLTTIIFALLAAFVVWKVRSILGTRTGHEEPPQERLSQHSSAADVTSRQDEAANDTTGHSQRNLTSETRWAPFAVPGSDLWVNLDQLAKMDTSFTPREFQEGAKAAYEMILLAFSNGDRATLKPLLSKEVFDSFATAISERENNGQVAETTLVSIERAEIKKVVIKGTIVQVVVGFNSKLISAIRVASGSVIEGSAEKVVDMTDIWTFSRDSSSRDPNWRLISTEDA
jgi:predicted lipid-binding transport protein (Tim44 family)